MATKKYYAIAVGRQPGIYELWPLAKAQVEGFAGAVYKGFLSRAEAEAWLAHPPTRRPAARRGAHSPAPSQPAPEKTAVCGEGVTIYTDGGARYNPGPGGYGVVILEQGERRELSAGYRLTTNNRMELMGCVVALRSLRDRCLPITLHSDSSYVVNGINKGWAKSWRRNGWLKSDRQPAINPDLWEELLRLVEGLTITFVWVKGHAGHPLNERCDQLAVAASRGAGLPEDTGYQKG